MESIDITMAIAFAAELLSVLDVDLKVILVVVDWVKLGVGDGLIHFDIELLIGAFGRPELCEVG